MQVKVIYEGELDVVLDEKIRKGLESVGLKWYAQGKVCPEGSRDICFDYNQPSEEKEESQESTHNNRSDVICEWKFDDDSGCFDTNCGHNIQDEETTSTWVYCPHCSRKIRTCG